MKKLGNMATIRSGYPFRKKVQHTPSSWDFYVLQLKDVQKNCHIDMTKATKVKMTEDKPLQPLQKGDILLRARGGYYYSGLFTADTPNAIAAGQFFVLRPNTEILDPAYLCWYLNQPVAQQYLEKNDTGTNIPMINKRTISDLPVTLPSLATQHKIANIHQSWLKEKKLTEQLLNNREQMLRGMCQEFINQDLMSRDTK
ncbi:MAG: restriction endonuclease subunit S [Gammaproteobacteria bacterium]|nr:restriction endonuclease subunit S [Gammaproteobacteria bacterium]